MNNTATATKSNISHLPTSIATTAELRLTAFLYILMQEELPTGMVEKMTMDVNRLTSVPRYSNPGLATYAKELASKILK